MQIQSNEDVVLVRQATREMCAQLGFSLVEQTKMVTAASELARNALDYAGGGQVSMDVLERDRKRGLRMTFEDHGPGIADLATALRDGFTTGSGLGLGLGGAKRLVDDFDLWSEPGSGTRVTITRWK
jgi:serine/threonine-protein kinase RsbT